VSPDDAPKGQAISPEAPTRPSLNAEAPTIPSQPPPAVGAAAEATPGQDLQGTPVPITPPELKLAAGTLVADRYRIQKVIGMGGMGIVYKVHDEVLGLDLALKLLRAEIAHDADFLQRFRNELVVARQVTHRNAVRIHDLGEHEGTYFMSMDLVEGRSLQDVLKEEGKLELKRAVRIVRQVADALVEAHHKGVVHRDLKPANILLDREDNAYITDFGIARSRSVPGLTRTGEVLGTPDYLSPEQARGEIVDARSDLYSLGLMFLEMLSGKRPFPGGTIFEVLAQRMTAKIAPLAELGISVPPTWATILQRCVANEKEQRYQSAEELVADLDDLRRPGQRLRKRQAKKAALAIAALSLAVLLGLGLQRLWDRRTMAPSPLPEAVQAIDLPATQYHAVAVLPFVDQTGAEDLAWTSDGLTEILTTELAEHQALRVVDNLRVLRRLQVLGADPGHLRQSQLRQLGKTFQIDRLVIGRLGTADGHLMMEGQLVELDGTEPSIERLAVHQGDPAQIFDLLEDLRLDLLEALELEPRNEENGERHRPVLSAMAPYSEGLGLLSRGDAAHSAAALTRAVAEDPQLASAWLRLAQTRLELGRQVEALDAARQAVRATDGEHRLGVEARAQEALLRGDPTAAQEVLERLVTRYPYDAEARLSLAEAFGQQGRFTDAIGHLERAVELDNGNPRSWYLLGRYAIGVGELRRAVDEYLVRALVLENTLRNETGQALVLNALGVGYQRLGLLDQAHENYEKAAAVRRRIGDAPGLTSTLLNLVWVNLARGAFENAEANIQNALEIQKEIGDPSGLGELYNTYGALEEERGRYPEALKQYRRSLQLLRDLGDERALAECHNNVGFTYYLLAEYDNALLHLEKALGLHRQNEQRSGIVRTLQSVGFCRLAQGEWSGADASFREALDLARELEERLAVSVSLGNLGRVAQLEGRYKEAFGHYREGLDLLTELEDQRGLVELSLYEAETALELGDLATTEERLGQVEEWLDQGGNREQQARLRLLQGQRHLLRGELEAAAERLAAAVADAEASHSVVTALEAKLSLGRVALAEKRFEEARRLLLSILSEAEELDHTRLRLQSAEATAIAQLATGDFTAAEEILRTALRLVASGDSYAGTFRLHTLLAQTLEATQKSEAASRARRDAVESLESLRQEISPERLKFFDTLPAVRPLLGSDPD